MIIPCCFENDGTSESTLELHGFEGAFPKVALGIRLPDSFGHVSSQIVMSEYRIVPIKIMSLPRLELLAKVINL